MIRASRLILLAVLNFGCIAGTHPAWSLDATPPANQPEKKVTTQDPPAPGGPTSSTNHPAPADDVSLGNQDIYNKSLSALTMLFVVAVLLENAFAVIFNWRVFLVYFSLRGVKTIIMIVGSFLVVYAFHLDVMASLIAAYRSPASGPAIDPASISKPVSMVMTALILAGGSAGVNRIMKALGFRSDRPEDKVLQRPPANQAWIAVKVTRQHAVEPVKVTVRDLGAAAANSPSPIAGAITFKRAGLTGLLLRDVNRFPQNGGYTLVPNHVYEIVAESKDATGAPLTALHNEQYVFAPGAIVDFLVTL